MFRVCLGEQHIISPKNQPWGGRRHIRAELNKCPTAPGGDGLLQALFFSHSAEGGHQGHPGGNWGGTALRVPVLDSPHRTRYGKT